VAAERQATEYAPAFKLPINHYAEFVEVRGSKELIFARIEKLRPLVTDQDFDLIIQK
jgi:hypothetical protein